MEYTVAAVDKAVGLLFLIADQPGLGVTELARRSGNTKARAFRLLDTLEQRGLIQRHDEVATYRLGYKALFLGNAAYDQLNLVRLAKMHLPEIGARCNESVLVRIREGLETVCIARWDSTHEVRVHNEIGGRRPLYVGASGKLLLAFAPPEVQDMVLPGDLQQFTPNTIIEQSKLVTELSRIRVQGYGVSFGERTEQITSVAAPIRDGCGNVVAALGITGPLSRISDHELPALIEIVRTGAHRFSRQLGYRERR